MHQKTPKNPRKVTVHFKQYKFYIMMLATCTGSKFVHVGTCTSQHKVML